MDNESNSEANAEQVFWGPITLQEIKELLAHKNPPETITRRASICNDCPTRTIYSDSPTTDYLLRKQFFGNPDDDPCVSLASEYFTPNETLHNEKSGASSHASSTPNRSSSHSKDNENFIEKVTKALSINNSESSTYASATECSNMMCQEETKSPMISFNSIAKGIRESQFLEQETDIVLVSDDDEDVNVSKLSEIPEENSALNDTYNTVDNSTNSDVFIVISSDDDEDSSFEIQREIKNEQVSQTSSCQNLLENSSLHDIDNKQEDLPSETENGSVQTSKEQLNVSVNEDSREESMLNDEDTKNEDVSFMAKYESGHNLHFPDEYEKSEDVSFAAKNETEMLQEQLNISLHESSREESMLNDEYEKKEDLSFTAKYESGHNLLLPDEYAKRKDVSFTAKYESGHNLLLSDEYEKSKDVCFTVKYESGHNLLLPNEYEKSEDVSFAAENETDHHLHVLGEVEKNEDVAFKLQNKSDNNFQLADNNEKNENALFTANRESNNSSHLDENEKKADVSFTINNAAGHRLYQNVTCSPRKAKPRSFNISTQENFNRNDLYSNENSSETEALNEDADVPDAHGDSAVNLVFDQTNDNITDANKSNSDENAHVGLEDVSKTSSSSGYEFNDTLEEMEMALRNGLDYSIPIEPDTSKNFETDIPKAVYVEKHERPMHTYSSEHDFDRKVSGSSSDASDVGTKIPIPIKTFCPLIKVTSPKVPLKQDHDFKVPSKPLSVSRKTPDLKGILSPVAIYIKNSPRVPQVQHVPTRTLPKGPLFPKRFETKEDSNKENIQDLPCRVYKPAKCIITPKEKDLKLPVSIQKHLPRIPDVIKHTGRIGRKEEDSASIEAKLLADDLTIQDADLNCSESVHEISMLTTKKTYIK